MHASYSLLFLVVPATLAVLWRRERDRVCDRVCERIYERVCEILPHARPPRPSSPLSSSSLHSLPSSPRLVEAATTTPLVTSRGTQHEEEDEEDDFLQVRHHDSASAPLFHSLTTRCAEDCYDKHLVVLREENTVREALEEMHARRVTCALLYDEAGELLGVFDTPDVLRYLLRSSACMASSARRVLRQCLVAPSHLPLGEVCRHLRAGLRYVAVACAHDKTAHRVVSQRAVAAALVRAAEEDEEGLARTLATARVLSQGHVVSVEEWQSARQAFEKMAAYGITSVPVLSSSSGRARAVISATDVLYARHDTSRLEANVLSYLAESRRDAGNARPVHAIVSCTKDEDVLTVLRLMMHEAVHHVYVLQDDVPVGVLSLVDVLRCV